MKFLRTWITLIGSFGLTLAVLWLVGQWRAATAPWTEIWQRALTRRRGPSEAKRLIDAAHRRLPALKKKVALPHQPAMRKHLLENILPGLALYQALLAEDPDLQAARAEIDAVLRATVYQRRGLQLGLLRRMPFQRVVFRLVLRNAMRAYPPEGWAITPRPIRPDRVAFDIRRCYYLDTLTALGAPELTAAFCKGDEVMAELFPPTVRFERENTLARGGACCDFAYVQEQPMRSAAGEAVAA